jgi:hypothetical protein
MNYIETESKSNYLYFYSYTPHNLLIIKKIANIEYKILSYYKKFYKIKKKIVFNLFNLLNSGRIKIYKENHYAEEFTDFTSHLESNFFFSEQSFNGLACEGGDKFTLASEGKFSAICPEKMAKIVLKISGIWETSENIGITYKFTEMFQKNSFIV